MIGTVSISPLTRIEGHLAIHASTEPAGTGDEQGFRVSEARCEGEMYRGFEQILVGRDPMDAQQITQRICGVCPVSHGIASVQAQEMAYGIHPTRNGRLLQNLILAANYLQSHILHFYHLAALDFVDVTAVLAYEGVDRTLQALKTWVATSLARKDVFPAAPFLPRFEAEYVKDADRNIALLAHYVQALEMRRVCHEMGAIFGARLPHTTALVPGGCTQVPTMAGILEYQSRLKRVLGFIEATYLPDLLEVAKEFPDYFEMGVGYNNYLCYGVFPMDDGYTDRFLRPGVVMDGAWEALDPSAIREDVAQSRYANAAPKHPSQGESQPQANKSDAYSWIKAPRYKGSPMEVGPLARVMANYLSPKDSFVKAEVDAFLSQVELPAEKLRSVLGRHVARGLETKWIARQAFRWLDELQIDEPPTRDFELPKTGSGVGLTEAPRGALGHWLAIKDYRIERYQCVVPTTWNCSPRDSAGKPGPVEKALEGTKVRDEAQPIEVGRVVRSFDPCLACAVH
ncbi:MAG: nickel-dependent hydrogenase large subunit [Phycisphaerae bacterium]|nr:nickel-dependent hydrogenase large subunit [Phycisphaerae bacterium]